MRIDLAEREENTFFPVACEIRNELKRRLHGDGAGAGG